MTSLIVDGARPAVTWVSMLPRSWVTDRERLVLLVLACDAFEDVSRPGGEVLAAWAGLINGRLYEVLGSLTTANATRPALLERLDKNGVPIPPGNRYGSRERTGYRLRVELDPDELSRQPGRVEPELSHGAGRDEQLSRGAGRDEMSVSPPLTGTLPNNSPGELSRGTLPGNSPGGPGDSLPFPPLPTGTDTRSTASRSTPTPLPDGWEPNHTHLLVMQDNGLDTDVVADFKARRVVHENRADWDATFGRFIKLVVEGEGREDVEFPFYDDDDDAGDDTIVVADSDDDEATTSLMSTPAMTTVVKSEITPVSTPTTEMTTVSMEIRPASHPECDECGCYLDRDGTCPVKANHQRRYGT